MSAQTFQAILLFGPPGSGKTTFARLLKKETRYPFISAGSELRAFTRKCHSAKYQEMALNVARVMDAGDLVDAIYTNAIVGTAIMNCIKKSPPGIIIDGYPRKAGELGFTEGIFTFGQSFVGKNAQTTLVHLDLPVEECKRRIEEDRERGDRTDNDPITIENRIIQHYTLAIPVLKHYQRHGRVLTLNATKAPSELIKDFLEQTIKRRGVMSQTHSQPKAWHEHTHEELSMLVVESDERNVRDQVIILKHGDKHWNFIESITSDLSEIRARSHSGTIRDILVRDCTTIGGIPI